MESSPKKEESSFRVLLRFKRDIEKIIVRDFIENTIPNYDETKTYIIYNGKTISEYDEAVLDLKKTMDEVERYYISKPLRALGYG